MKPSVPQSVAELKALLKDLDKFLLRKALELAREWYRAILEEVDELLAKRRAEDLTADGDTFWAGMTFHQRYDLTGVKDTVVGGDGAGWVKEGVSYVNGRFQLDRYHSHRELCRALGRDSETKRRVWNACEDGTVEVGLALLAEAKGKARGEQAEKIARVYRYRQANSSGLGDYRVGLGEEGEYIMS